jgi:hypothetical protein
MADGVKLLGVMNGWRDAPQCWPLYLHPFPKIRRYPYPKTYTFAWFGFVLFVEVA